MVSGSLKKFAFLLILYKIDNIHKMDRIENMQTITSQRVQTKFGEFSDLVKRQNEPVIITQYKRPTMVVFSYEAAMEMMKLSAKMRFLQGLQENAQYCDEPSDEELAELNRLIDDEREHIYQQNKK